MGWIFASNPVLVLLKFPMKVEESTHSAWCSSDFWMTGKGRGAQVEPPGAALLGAGLSERHLAGGASWSSDGTPGSCGLGVWGAVSAWATLCQRPGFPGPPQSTLALQRWSGPGSISESSRFEASSAPFHRERPGSGPRVKPLASYC